MIIDVRGILSRIEKDKENSNDYSLDMVYQDGSFVPKLTKGEPKITIPPIDSAGGITRELVGLTVAFTGPGRGKMNHAIALCNNGLFIDINAVKAKDLIILPSFSDAVKFVNLLYDDQYARQVITKYGDKDLYCIWAVYQEFGTDNVSCKFVYKP